MADGDYIDSTHPATDVNIDTEEQYDEGLAAAAEAAEPNPRNAVVAYRPKGDKGRVEKVVLPST